MKSYLSSRSLLCVLFALLLSATPSVASNEHNTEGESATASSSEDDRRPTSKTSAESDFDPSNEDWGSYYDPQNIFCGKFDCYKILGFDYESFGKVKPDTKEITKRYRQLSREWHPDKSKHKNAKERFVKIARAYEVLTDREQRKEYDDLRYNQEAYFMKYGSSVLWSYAPQTDTTIVVIVLFLLGNIASWYMQKHRWQMVANRLIKAALEDWTPSQGGTAESKQLREEALAILAEREEPSGENAETVPAKSGTQKAAGKAKQKLSLKDKKKQEQDALEPIITGLVNDIKDFGGGFHQPTWKDLMVVGLIKLPMKITAGIIWETKYWIRRARNIELSDEEKDVLTERAVGSVAWDIASEEDREEMLKRQLWVKENLIDWKEDQEIKNLSAADQKYYNKLKKKGKLE
ncbi:hypothetical protein FisN_13Hh203 [Fistulifera solaris]|uniref:J domain-containing protein n=1 Tax=Fistulifera solaris TaxID=1519565 RepID=A0A1Z5KNW2_FISSO|nr:hypothetical protein FisN_13Hh203 [Fistulifera solaris]|eukprot:GAX27701.1 hypothetical protein FisN_13Hh203 [Fistulifera solaris]